MVKIFKKAASKVAQTAKAIAKDQAERVTNVGKVLASALLGSKITGIEIKATTPSKTLNKALETAASHPFTTAGVVTGVSGAAKAVAPAVASLGKSALAAAPSVAKLGVSSAVKAATPTLGKAATITTAAVVMNPSLLTATNIKYAVAAGLSPVGAAVGFVTAATSKTSKAISGEVKEISSQWEKGGFSSLSTVQKAEVIGAPLVGAALTGAAVYGAGAITNLIKSGGSTKTVVKEATNELIRASTPVETTEEIPKTPTLEQPKVITGGAIEDLGTAGSSDISAFKQNGVITPEIVKKHHKHRKINKLHHPSQSQKQNIINQVYVGG